VELCNDHDKLPRISRDYGDLSAPVCAAKASKPWPRQHSERSSLARTSSSTMSASLWAAALMPS